MDIRKVKKLLELIENSDISEIEITDKDESIKVTRYSGTAPVVATAAPTQVMVPEPIRDNNTSDDSGEPLPQGNVVNSPMVGTFYIAPSPESPSFTDIGQTVSKGETICIIEAMKILNQIESEHAGTVKAILVENGEPVEYGQPLFVIG